MAQQIINIGTLPNDGTGDTIRVAYTKINTNFTEVYAAIAGSGSGFFGISGFSGWSGFSGFSGFTGYSGHSGHSGINGSSGYTGISGYSGQPGITGLTGPAGISGKSGYSGFSGAGFTLTKSAFDAPFDTVVLLDNVKIRVNSATERPQVQGNSTTFTASWSGTSNFVGEPATINFTTPSATVTNFAWYDITTNAITTPADSYTILLQDTTNSKLYRITCTAGATGASIVIESLI